MAAKWKIELLGGLRASLGEVVIRRFPSQQAAALFARLAIHSKRSHTRDELMEMMWPGDDSGAARQRLSQILYLLRSLFDQVLPEGESILFTAAQQTVQFNCETAETDVTVFEHLASISVASPNEKQLADLQLAREAYRGELLPGFQGEWVAMERQRLADLYGSVLVRLAGLSEHEGLLEQATSTYMQLVEVDPLQEEHHLGLIRLYGARGQTSRALAQYERLAKILKDEFADEPSLATKSLIEKVRRRELVHGEVEMRGRELFGPSVLLESSPPTLPRQDSRFYGREQEIEETREILGRPEGRLATLVGLGGCGKTRLAVEIASRMLDEFSGAVWFVSLAEIPAAEEIPLAILGSLNLTAPANVNVSEVVVIALRRRPKSLLILDNFEHLAVQGGAEAVSGLLRSVPGVQILVTSRQRLGVKGEHLVKVSPLPAPPSHCCGAELLESPCIQLFVDRAKVANPSFSLGPDNAEVVRELCAKLECIPLALELAAACASEMTPMQILGGISHRFELLVSSRQDVPPRHRSLLSAIEHGFHLLPRNVQSFFPVLAVFEGGWTLEAAQYCGRTPEAAQHLKELSERSLVRVVPSQWGERYEMLDTIREYAWQHLAEDRREAVRLKHAECFAKASEEASVHAGAAGQAKWLASLSAEHENLMSALRFCQETGNAPLGLRIAISLQWYWEAAGPLSEGLRWLTCLIELPAEEPPPSAIGALGSLAWARGDFVLARTCHEKCLAMRRAMNDSAGEARALYDLGITFYRMGELERTGAYIEESLSIATEIDDKAGVARAALNLGNLAVEKGDLVSAKGYFEQSVVLERALGNKSREADALSNLARIAYLQKRYGLAAHYLEEVLRSGRELASKPIIARALSNLGITVGRQRQWGRAVRLIAESMRINKVWGSMYQYANSLAALAWLAAEAGDLKMAAVLLGGADSFGGTSASGADSEDRRETEAAILAALSPEEYRAALVEGKTLGLEGVFPRVFSWIESFDTTSDSEDRNK